MARNNLQNEYFEWMYNLVCNDQYYNNRGMTYRKLLTRLHKIEFVYILEMDENRAIDGVEFRYRFGYEMGYPRNIIEQDLDIRPCSVLEMMIALAFGVEEHIMDDPSYGNRTGQWFWNMVVSLGLGKMTDDNFDRNYVDDVIDIFLRREYRPNGDGGLFIINNPRRDLRYVEIWHQCMWYLNDFLDN